jgi:flagellar basal body rod protein FlgF
VFISDLTNAGAIPVLEATMRFAAQRQRLIAHNIANLSTPDFRPLDVSVPAFQKSLREAVEARRAGRTAPGAPLQMGRNPEVEVAPDGALRLSPRTATSNAPCRIWWRTRPPSEWQATC